MFTSSRRCAEPIVCFIGWNVLRDFDRYLKWRHLFFAKTILVIINIIIIIRSIIIIITDQTLPLKKI